MKKRTLFMVCEVKDANGSANLKANILHTLGVKQREYPMAVSPRSALSAISSQYLTETGKEVADLATVAIQIQSEDSPVGRTQSLSELDGMEIINFARLDMDCKASFTAALDRNGLVKPETHRAKISFIDAEAVVWLRHNFDELRSAKMIVFPTALRNGNFVNVSIIFDTTIISDITNLANLEDNITELPRL